MVEGWTVSPRKSRRKSACFSSTTTSIPARANNSPNTSPAGPPPTTAHVVRSVTPRPASPPLPAISLPLPAHLTHPPPKGTIPLSQGIPHPLPPLPLIRPAPHRNASRKGASMTETIHEVDVAVIGGGQAGLASGYFLTERGYRPHRDFVIFDRSP